MRPQVVLEGFVCEGKVFETHVTLLYSRLHSEKAADNTVVSEDDFQFPSAEYEIIVLPILPAKLERQRNTTAKSSVCNTRNETVTFLYGIITEINLGVDTETSMGWRRAQRRENRHQSQKSFKSFPMHEFGNTSQCKVEQPVFCYLISVLQRR